MTVVTNVKHVKVCARKFEEDAAFSLTVVNFILDGLSSSSAVAFSSGLLPSVGLATLGKLKPVPIVERVEPNPEAEWFGCRRSPCRGLVCPRGNPLPEARQIHESVLRRESAFFCRTKPIQPGGKSQRRHPGIRTRRLDVSALCAAAVSGLSPRACTGVPVSVEAVRVNSQSLLRSSVIDTAWGSLVVEIGYTFTASLEDCRNHMLKVGGRKISAQDVAKIISSLSESPPGRAVALAPPVHKGQGSRSWNPTMKKFRSIQGKRSVLNRNLL
ncbi:uncharacterized protein LOC119771132 [Culex quinquefasciatus]|uniref:uncharacterized protein LOC119771132 n=1 Tax=Culex quinquefasciatus TaxID=7176 RepID=UPI0018E3CE5E|nr:uncharacterized protein LOC119771132 [Culex quinquefasciatus]